MKKILALRLATACLVVEAEHLTEHLTRIKVNTTEKVHVGDTVRIVQIEKNLKDVPVDNKFYTVTAFKFNPGDRASDNS